MTDLTIKLTRIASRAVRKAQEENRKNGVPNVYVINGKNVWQLPDGSFTDKSPFWPQFANCITETPKMISWEFFVIFIKRLIG